MQSTFKSVQTTLAITLLFISISATSFSQNSRFSVSLNSLTTNFNYGASNGDLKSYKKDFKGLQVGVSYQAGISPVFSVVPELYFAMKGGTLKADNPLTLNQSTLRLNSIEMPVLARLHFRDLYLNAGPYVDYTLSGRIKIVGSEAVPETSTKISFGNAVEDFKRWDFGVQAGAGYNFNMKRSVLTLDVRYGYGLVNISKNITRYNRLLNISLVVSKPQKREQTEK